LPDAQVGLIVHVLLTVDVILCALTAGMKMKHRRGTPCLEDGFRISGFTKVTAFVTGCGMGIPYRISVNGFALIGFHYNEGIVCNHHCFFCSDDYMLNYFCHGLAPWLKGEPAGSPVLMVQFYL